VQSGRLRHRVTIQSATETRDAVGAVTKTWATLASVWASVEPLGGREFFSASQVQSDVTTRIRIRYRADVTEKMRVVHVADSASSLTNYYDITAVIPLNEKRHELHLMCVKRGQDGFRNG
jgi:SPP1 family predicted phage head-tail adaptor